MLSNQRWFTPCVRAVSFLLAWALAIPGAQNNGLRIVVLEGEGAINNIRTGTAKAPVIRVEDEQERPVSRAVVTFVAPDIGAGAVFTDGVTSTTVLTGEDGKATARGLKPNNVAGQFQLRVTATSQGRTATANITQTNVAPAGARGGPGKKLIILGLVAGGIAGAAFAAKGGSKSNTTPSPAPGTGTTLTPGSPIFGPPR